MKDNESIDWGRLTQEPNLSQDSYIIAPTQVRKEIDWSLLTQDGRENEESSTINTASPEKEKKSQQINWSRLTKSST